MSPAETGGTVCDTPYYYHCTAVREPFGHGGSGWPQCAIMKMKNSMKDIMKHLLLLGLTLCLVAMSFAQPRATVVEKLPLDSGHDWAAPRFSPDGMRIYFTQSGYDGIWEYTVASKAVRTITS